MQFLFLIYNKLVLKLTVKGNYYISPADMFLVATVAVALGGWAGAAIGTAICPGVGSAIGGVVGAIAAGVVCYIFMNADASGNGNINFTRSVTQYILVGTA